MAHYIYFFSKFTDEAIVFELFAFFLLVSMLTAYYILSRRFMREGDKLIPMSALRAYLDKNIMETNDFRMALLGDSLNVGDLPAGTGPANYVAPTSAVDQSKVVELQAQLFNQQKMIEDLKTQKQQIEAQVAAGGGAVASAGGGGGGGNPAETEDLRNRLKNAEDRLAEYSVIEDDLANLKRLQQENAKLKAQLGGGAEAAGAPIPVPAAKTPSPVATPATETPAPTPASATAAPETVVDPTPPAAAAAPTLDAELDTSLSESTTDIDAATKAASPAPGDASGDGNFKDQSTVSAAPAPDFEAAVDQVEAALTPDAPKAVAPIAETAAPEAAKAASPAPAETKNEAKPKNDEDLLAEFEKMLGN